MPDELKPSMRADRSATLAQIAEALGLPVSCFHEAGRGARLAEHRAELDGPVLALVRKHLQAAEPEARRLFVEAVKKIADELSL